MFTYQDFITEAARRGEGRAIARAIREHEASEMVAIAKEADLYDRQKNVTINRFVQTLFTGSGAPVENFVASNNKKASNFFNILNTQRNSYLLGNGVAFATSASEKADMLDGAVSYKAAATDAKAASAAKLVGGGSGTAAGGGPGHSPVKEKLGPRFDNDLLDAGYYALIHGVSFCFWNIDRMHVFRLTEFAPLWDEETGALRAGVRYWCIDRGRKPVMAVLYTEDGVTRYKSKGNGAADFVLRGALREPYRLTTSRAPADEHALLVAGDNYGALPIVPLYGSRLHQSTLVGMKEAIDSYDIIANGWCNDVRDCAQVYWLLENYGGMSEADIERFRDRMLTMHIAAADTSGGGKVTPYAQEIPYESRDALLTRLREDIYRDFGGLDTQALAASSLTATAIRAAYEGLSQKADDFEMQVIACVQGILRLIGVTDTPVFKRSMVSNELEQVQMVMLEAPVLDERTLLAKLPNITDDEVEGIMLRRGGERDCKSAAV